jgi:hypothetical protein
MTVRSYLKLLSKMIGNEKHRVVKAAGGISHPVFEKKLKTESDLSSPKRQCDRHA